MADRTGIAWTDATWNPIRGCSRVSEGCRNCYAESVAARFSGAGLPYEGLTRDGKWTGEVRVVEEHMADPLRWSRPRRIFVNSMSDLFHPSVADETIDRVFAVMAIGASSVERCFRRDCSHDPCEGDGAGYFTQHVFQILTKRPERALAYLSSGLRQERITEALSDVPGFTFGDSVYDGLCDTWPLPHVWLGVSVEDQKTADARVPLLLQTPAAVRFISYEPALGPVDFTRLGIGDERELNALHGYRQWTHQHVAIEPERVSRLDWIIVGGESGPRARPFQVEWARQTVADCKTAGVACFVKQLGARAVGLPVPNDGRAVWRDGRFDGRLRDRAGADPAEWPEDLRVREFPTALPESGK